MSAIVCQTEITGNAVTHRGVKYGPPDRCDPRRSNDTIAKKTQLVRINLPPISRLNRIPEEEESDTVLGICRELLCVKIMVRIAVIFVNIIAFDYDRAAVLAKEGAETVDMLAG